MRLLLVLVALLSVLPCTSYKILVFNPKFGHSHSNFMGGVADILSDAGHNVTTIISEVDTTAKDGTTKTKIIRVQSPAAREMFRKVMSKHGDFFASSYADLFFNLVFGRQHFSRIFALNCRAVVSQPGLVEMLKAEKYDVVISENFEMCGTGLSHVIQPRATIFMSSCDFFAQQHAEFGMPASLSFNPNHYMLSMDVHSIWDRMKNLYADALERAFFGNVRALIREVLVEKFGRDFPSFEEISSRAAYVMSNSEPLIDFASPTLYKAQYIGGLGARPPQPLDQYWVDVLARRPRNALLSFGSVAKSKDLSPQIKRSILKTVSRFPDVTFIWKYEDREDEFARREASKKQNLVLSSWMPQNDLLANPNVTLFISHGGMGSVMETALRGVPALLIPIFADQPRNAASMQHSGVGKVFSKFDLPDDEKLTAAVKELLENEKYTTEAKRLSQMLAKKPYQAREVLIKHVEFAAEFGPSSSLRPQSHDMTFIAYYNLDIILIAFILFLIVGYLIVKVLSMRPWRLFGLTPSMERMRRKAKTA